MLSVQDALKKVTSNLPELKTETANLSEAYNRTLGKDLISTFSQPPFNSSAMDGYAVKYDDITSLPQTLEVVGESAAGHAYSGVINNGQAVRIFTGAVIPEGCDTVVIQENTEQLDGKVTILNSTEKGRNIRSSGTDFMTGETVLKAGTVLNARSISLAAAMNLSEIPVKCRPKVAIIATGDELVEPGQTLLPDQIVSSIPSGLAAMINTWGGKSIQLGIARDTKESLSKFIDQAAQSDLIVTIGGASVGDHDLVQKTFSEHGMELDFWKIAMRPGKPLMFGKIHQTPILGLPGNPVSALICARLFISAMIFKFLGRSIAPPVYQKAILVGTLQENGPREHYMRATSSINDNGDIVVEPAQSQDSSLLKTFSKSNCLIVRPPHAPELKQGNHVTIMPLEIG